MIQSTDYTRSQTMKNRVFIKKNVFSCLMFGALILFVLYQTFFCDSDLSMLAFLIVIPTFVLSVLKLIVDITEDINNKMTGYLYFSNSLVNQPIFFEVYQKAQQEDNKDLIEGYNKSILHADSFEDYKRQQQEEKESVFNGREKIRKVRRVVLYVYYAVFMVMVFALLIHTELSKFIIEMNIIERVNVNKITIWSLVVILIEILMKDIFEDIIFVIYYKKIGIDLKWY